MGDNSDDEVHEATGLLPRTLDLLERAGILLRVEVSVGKSELLSDHAQLRVRRLGEDRRQAVEGLERSVG